MFINEHTVTFGQSFGLGLFVQTVDFLRMSDFSASLTANIPESERGVFHKYEMIETDDERVQMLIQIGTAVHLKGIEQVTSRIPSLY